MEVLQCFGSSKAIIFVLGIQYGVTTISRLLRIIGLFSKRVPQKRLYYACSLDAQHPTIMETFKDLNNFLYLFYYKKRSSPFACESMKVHG